MLLHSADPVGLEQRIQKKLNERLIIVIDA
jgi:hypothetical protein